VVKRDDLSALHGRTHIAGILHLLSEQENCSQGFPYYQTEKKLQFQEFSVRLAFYNVCIH
jgi:hypothetical protein